MKQKIIKSFSFILIMYIILLNSVSATIYSGSNTYNETLNTGSSKFSLNGGIFILNFLVATPMNVEINSLDSDVAGANVSINFIGLNNPETLKVDIMSSYSEFNLLRNAKVFKINFIEYSFTHRYVLNISTQDDITDLNGILIAETTDETAVWVRYDLDGNYTILESIYNDESNLITCNLSESGYYVLLSTEDTEGLITFIIIASILAGLLIIIAIYKNKNK